MAYVATIIAVVGRCWWFYICRHSKSPAGWRRGRRESERERGWSSTCYCGLICSCHGCFCVKCGGMPQYQQQNRHQNVEGLFSLPFYSETYEMNRFSSLIWRSPNPLYPLYVPFMQTCHKTQYPVHFFHGTTWYRYQFAGYSATHKQILRLMRQLGASWGWEEGCAHRGTFNHFQYTFCGSHKIYIIIDVMNINIKMQLGGLLVDDGHAWRKEKWRLRFKKGTYKITTKTLHIDICL